MTARRVLAALAVALVAALLPAAPASADVNDFEIESVDVDLTLGRDDGGRATLEVAETIVPLFPDFDQNRGIVRSIPDTYFDHSLHTRVEGVWDENGDPVHYEVESDSGWVYVLTGDDSFVHGRTTYVIRYSQRDVIGDFETGPEFYWDVPGDDTPQPVHRVTANLTLDDGIAADLTGDSACYRGSYGSTGTCELQRTDSGFTVTDGELGPYETLSVAIGFRGGAFTFPPKPEDSFFAQVAPWILLALAGALLLASIVLRIVKYRHAPGRGIVVAQYQGPDVPLLTSAMLLGKQKEALPAFLIHLAVTRAATLSEKDGDYTVTIADLDRLPAGDRSAAAGILGSSKPGRSLELDRKETDLGDRIATVMSTATSSLGTRKLVASTRTRATTVLQFAITIVWIASIALFFWADGDWMTQGWPVVGLSQLTGVLSIVGLFVVRAPRKRTAKGSELYEQLQGVRDYLQLAEADRIRMLQSPEGAERQATPTGDEIVKLYERLLPYAILWGIEDEWQRVLGSYYATTPTEVAPQLSSLRLGSFANSYVASSFAQTRPVSSSGGSSSGGGFSFSGGSSGGGFSGGGGGGGGIGGR